MRNKRFVLTIIILVAACAAGLAVLARTPLLLRSVSMLSAPLFGYDINAESFSFFPLVLPLFVTHVTNNYYICDFVFVSLFTTLYLFQFYKYFSLINLSIYIIHFIKGLF